MMVSDRKSNSSVPAAAFTHFSTVMKTIHRTRSRQQKTVLFADYLATLNTPMDVRRAIRFAGIEPPVWIRANHIKNSGNAPVHTIGKTGAGNRTVALTAADFCDIDYEMVFKVCRNATGSTLETIELLLTNMPQAQRKRSADELLWNLSDVEQICFRSFQERKSTPKKQILIDCMRTMPPDQVRALLHVMGLEHARFRLPPEILLDATARTYNNRPDLLHKSFLFNGLLDHTVALAQDGKLNEPWFQLLRSTPFILTTADATNFLSEYLPKPAKVLYGVILYANPKNVPLSGYFSEFTIGVLADQSETGFEAKLTDQSETVSETARDSNEDYHRMEASQASATFRPGDTTGKTTSPKTFIPVGKVSSGFTRKELEKLNQLVGERIIERFGPVRSVRPEIVMKVHFDDIRPNKRTKAGFSLQSARFQSLRPDIPTSQCSTIHELTRLLKEKKREYPQKT